MITISILWIVIPLYVLGMVIFYGLIGLLFMDSGIEAVWGRLLAVLTVLAWPVTVPIWLIGFALFHMVMWLVKGDNY